MTRQNDIPQDVWDEACACWKAMGFVNDRLGQLPNLAIAIMRERARWNPAVTYFNNYCLDEADDVENCVCGDEQHQAAKAFAAVVKAGG